MLEQITLRRIKHEGRGRVGAPLWISSWLAPYRCVHPELKAYIQGLVNAQSITLVGKKSGSGIHMGMHPSCKLVQPSPFADIFDDLEGIPQKRMHYNVEKTMMSKVNTVVATELPLSTPNNEGLIDVVMDTPEAVYILDYKPGAKSTNAVGQLSCYSVLLSEITGIPLSEFRIGWFDEHSFWKGLPDPDVRKLL